MPHAAWGGRLEIMKWPRVRECPWAEDVRILLLNTGTWDVRILLQWARGHDCPWDVRNCAHAAEKGHAEVLRWAEEHGCPGGEQYWQKRHVWWLPWNGTFDEWPCMMTACGTTTCNECTNRMLL